MKPQTSLAQRHAEWIVRYRWLVLIVGVALTLLAASGARRLGFIDEYRVFFGPDNPQVIAFDEVEAIYTKNDNILILLEPSDGEVFSPDTLSAVEELTAEAWKTPFAIRVDSLSNFQHSWAEGDDLVVEDLIEEAQSLDVDQLNAKREIALNEPFLRDRIVPPKANVVGLSITLQLPRESPDETTLAVTHARQISADLEERHPNIETHITGMVMLNNAFQESSMRDMATLVPLMYLIIIATMVLLLRSFSATFATVVIIGLSVAGALGLAGWAGMSLTPPSTASITMIMTLAVADSIHILVTLLREMRSGLSKNDAIIESLRVNAQPVFLTSLTTCIGFLSMNFSEVPPLNDLGNISATGVAIAWLLSITVLPALIAVLPLRARQRAESPKGHWMDRMGSMVVDKRRPLLWGSALVAIVLSSFVSFNSLNDQFIDYFDETMAFRQDSDFAMENLSGIYQVDFSLGSGESSGISEPVYLENLEAFANWYREQPGVVHVATLSDVLKRLNKNLHGDDQSYYRLPDSRELAAQYLLLYEMSLPYGLDLNNQINVDKSATRLTVTVDNVTSNELIALVESGEGWLVDNAPESMEARGVGPGVMFSYIAGRNATSMIYGTILAVLLIGLTLMVALKSVKFGLLSLIPNLLPALVAFGIWGVLVGQVNLGLSIVSGMCLGIVVDDSVHFLSKYLRARRERGLSPQQAVRYAFSTVGLALVVTSIVLAAGFLVLAQSSFGFNGGMGKLAAIIIAIALIADLLFLPPLLMKLEEKYEGAAKKEDWKNDYVTAS